MRNALILLFAIAANPAGAAPSWSKVAKLFAEEKYEAASKEAQKRLDAAISKRDEKEWAHALVRLTQARIQLHDEETAVRMLMEQPWPEGPLPRTTVELYYAHALLEYQRMHGWEMRQRERVESRARVDLKAWTSDQLREEIHRTFEAAWARREVLGRHRVEVLDKYLSVNNYPAGIRDTLRDAVTYLWVEALEDSSYWRPEQSNGLYRLDLPALIRGGGASGVKLSDQSVHPLVRIGAILDDLEAWHRAAGRQEAALEARLRRLSILDEHFTERDDRARIRQALQELIPTVRQLPWSARAMHQLAQSWRNAGNPQRANAVAQDCIKLHPRSLGARFCRSLADELNQPELQLSAMRLDGLGKRSLRLTHKNLKVAYFRAYALDLVRGVSTRGVRETLSLDKDARSRLLRGRPVAEWTVELPPTPDLRLHHTYATPPLDRRGLYAIAVSDRRDFARPRAEVSIALVLLSDLVMQASAEPGGAHEIRVLSGPTGQAVPGATVEVYAEDRDAHVRRVASSTTDGAGFARFEKLGAAPREESFFAMARLQDDASVHLDQLKDQPGSDEVNTALLYTDRSIYRPKQKVLWKAVAYRGVREQGRLSASEGEELTVSLLDANGKEVTRAKAKTNRFGSAAGELEIPSGRLLGAWGLKATSPRGLDAWTPIQVEEYKRPTFEVSIQDPPAPLRLNRPGRLVAQARYYFGLPVAGQARWKVIREPVYPWWWFGRRSPIITPQVIATGSSLLREDGTFELTFTAGADERAAARGISYHYLASADVTDEGGETRSASRGFRLGTTAVEARIELHRGFLVEGEARSGAGPNLSILRADLDGVPRPGLGRWRLARLLEPAEAALPADVPEPEPEPAEGESEPLVRTPGDRLRPRFPSEVSLETTLHGWAEGAKVAEGEVRHDAKGLAQVASPALEAGAYRLTYETVDPFGATSSVSKDFLVAGRRSAPKVAMVLVAERTTVRVGETARLLAGSGLPSQPMLLEVHRGQERVLRRQLQSGADGALLELPVGEEDRGGFTVSLTLVRDHQWLHLTQDIRVPRDDKELRIELATFRDLLHPGAKERFRVKVSGREGAVAAGAAEVLAYMYDRSLDYFVPHRPPTLSRLYPNRKGRPHLRANLHDARAFSPWLPERRSIDSPYLHGDELWFDPDADLESDGVMGGVVGGVVGGVLGGVMGRSSGEADAEESVDEAKSKPPELRQNFAETAFFRPQLLTDSSGAVTIEFTVPDSVTSWNLWVHAVTADMRVGSTRREVRTTKELMVRPYVPRFMREGDRADLKVVLNSAAERDLSTEVTFDVIDTERDASALDLFSGGPGKGDRRPRSVKVAKGGSANLQYALAAPARVGLYAVKVVATSGNLSDGELRPMPVLPSRMHLAQSRFVTLKNADRKELSFPDLRKEDDPSRINEQLVVNIDAQLAYTALEALPYLVEYPYECTEQTLNRFVSTAILSSLFKQYPAMAKMAEKLAASRTTQLETWDATDPNRKMALEETPWLVESGGGDTKRLVKVLDPNIAAAQREESLAKLRKAQRSDGSFPWWSGGPASPHMTLYIANGLARAAEYQAPIPKDMTQRAWNYLAGHFRHETGGDLKKLGYEFLTLLNYAATAYPDESYPEGALTLSERKRILDFTFDDWKGRSPYVKGLLALTLKRMGRPNDAKLVWDSVMDAAKTTPEQGTFWAPADRAWLWHNDTVETQAQALRVLTELQPQDPRRDGLVQWLLINKKLSHWKSTRATAEAVYALVKYLEQERALAIREELSVTVGARAPVRFAFEPDEYQGKQNRVVVAGGQLQPATDSAVVVEKATRGFAFASATWHFSTEKMPEEGRGDLFSLSRRYFRREANGREVTLRPLSDGERIQVGDQLEVQLSLRAKHAAEYVHLRDPRGAGFEPESATSGYRWQTGLGYYEEVRDSGQNFFFDWLPAGEYTFKARVRATMSGTFRVGPATVQSMYAPELNAYSAGHLLPVAP